MKKIYSLIIIIFLCIMSITSVAFISPYAAENIYDYSHTETVVQHKIDSLLNEVSTYIETYHANCPNTIPESLVKYGLIHDIDICFMMSQAQIETAFGKCGIGRSSSRKSIFGVMSKKYSTYDDAVNHYITVLNKYYLTYNRTEQDLLKKFATKSGKRYASNPKYEHELTAAYKNICNSTNIKQLQSQIKDLQINTIDFNKYF